MKSDLSLEAFTKPLGKLFAKALRYRALILFIAFACIYAFILYRINSLSSVQPDDTAISQAAGVTAQPHIDETVVKKIQDLQDNSVNVQSLFDQARQNPFQE